MSPDQSEHPPSDDRSVSLDALRERVRSLQDQLRRLDSQLASRVPPDNGRFLSALDQAITVLQPLAQPVEAVETPQPSSVSPLTRDAGPREAKDPSLSGSVLRGHLITDVYGTIQLADRAIANLLHCPHAQLIGERFQELFAEDVSALLSGYLKKIEQGEPGLEWEMSLSSKHGPTFSALITLTAIKAPDGSIVSVHWLVQDVTAYQRALAADAILQSMGEQILAGLTFGQLSGLICDRLVGTFGYPLVWIGVRNAEGRFEVVRWAGTHHQYLDSIGAVNTAENSRILAQAMKNSDMRIISAQCSEWGAWGQRLHSCGLDSGLCVPLCSEKVELGVMMVLASSPDAFGSGVISWFEQLGKQLAVSLSTVKQYDQLRVRDAAIATAEHAVFITDPHGCIEWVNDAYSRLTGVAAAELVGSVPSYFHSGVFPIAVQEARRNSKPGQFWTQELTLQHTDGRSFIVEQIVTPLRDEQGAVTHFVAIHHDITVRKESEAHIYHLAHYDSLTDLPNRVMFHDRLRQALAQARRYGHSVAVMFVDLDHFKLINDGLGHDCGDELLRLVARRLTHCVRESDTVARLSGDEFAIILQDLDRGQDAGHVAQKVLDSVSERLSVGDVCVATTASIGIALYPFDGTDPDVLLTRADRGMYRAKEKGGDCYQFLSEELNVKAFERLTLEKGLTQALSNSEFVLHYQPEVDVQSGRIVGMDALIRWQHDELGLVFPSQFMSLAKELGLLCEIQQWILASALQQLRAWVAEGFSPGRMLVKYPLDHAPPDSLHTEIVQGLTGADCPADQLRIALSYAHVVSHHDAARQLVGRLPAHGVGCVLDDVDSDDSLEQLLETCSFQALRLRSTVTAGFPSDAGAVNLLGSCLELAARFGIPLVAKGIESATQSSYLRERNCHRMQGYLIARPLPATEMTAALRSWWSSTV